MNNETIKKINVTIKLRGDNVYDLYVNGEWFSSHGNSDSAIEDIRDIAKNELVRVVL